MFIQIGHLAAYVFVWQLGLAPNILIRYDWKKNYKFELEITYVANWKITCRFYSFTV